MTEEQAKTATLDELRDWLAKADGWNLDPPSCGGHFAVIWWRYTLDAIVGTRTWSRSHPHPPTLDGAAAALPDGWAWSVESPSRRAFKGDDGMPRSVRAFADNADELTAGCFAPDELTARYRLAVLCRLAEKAVEK